MLILAGSPFAPDASSDWWNFGVNLLIGLATLATLLVSLAQARAALRESKHAMRTADRAAAREQERDAREAERERQLQLEGLRRRAARQALLVWSYTDWDQEHGSYFQFVVMNDSDAVIRDLVVRWEFDGVTRSWSKPLCVAHRGLAVGETLDAKGYRLDKDAAADFTLEFTDAASDRWRLYPDRKLELINERTFVVPS